MDTGPGRIEAIFVTPAAGSPAGGVDRARAVAGRGLSGDYHFDKRIARGGAAGKDLTLIEAESLEGLEADTGIVVAPGETLRNVLTRGVGLNALVGRRFTVGAVECFGVELCEPCDKLERMTRPGVLRGLVHRGGLRADILTDGDIAVGEVVAEL